MGKGPEPEVGADGDEDMVGDISAIQSGRGAERQAAPGQSKPEPAAARRPDAFLGAPARAAEPESNVEANVEAGEAQAMQAQIHGMIRVPSLYLPRTFPVPSLYLPCTFPVPSLYTAMQAQIHGMIRELGSSAWALPSLPAGAEVEDWVSAELERRVQAELATARAARGAERAAARAEAVVVSGEAVQRSYAEIHQASSPQRRGPRPTGGGAGARDPTSPLASPSCHDYTSASSPLRESAKSAKSARGSWPSASPAAKPSTPPRAPPGRSAAVGSASGSASRPREVAAEQGPTPDHWASRLSESAVTSVPRSSQSAAAPRSVGLAARPRPAPLEDRSEEGAHFYQASPS